MGRFIGLAFGFVLAIVLKCSTAQTVHVVGDSMGWTVPQGGAQAYINWGNGKNFKVGDILLFNFTTNEHDVLQVPKASFDACTSSNSIGDIITTGPANITLVTAGEHYYLCTIGRHCQFGQKLAITVSGTPGSSPPSKSPKLAPPTTPTTPVDCTPAPTPGPAANRPTGSTIAAPPNGSSSSKVLASALVSMMVIGMGLFV